MYADILHCFSRFKDAFDTFIIHLLQKIENDHHGITFNISEFCKSLNNNQL
jgi:hypothetical protein